MSAGDASAAAATSRCCASDDAPNSRIDPRIATRWRPCPTSLSSAIAARMDAGLALYASLISVAAPSVSQTPRMLGTGIAAMPAAASASGTPQARAVAMASMALAA